MESAEHLAQLVHALSGDVVRRHHADERRSLPDLLGRLNELAAAGAVQTDVLAPIADALGAITDMLLAHLEKEEHILFPAFEALVEAGRLGTGRPLLPFPSVLHPIRVMEADHERLGGAVGDLRTLVAAVQVPAALRSAWTEWRRALDGFAEELGAHLRLENEVLFPRALELEQALA